jgi:hypothetical protein
MKRNRYSSTAFVALLTAALLAVFPLDTLAQENKIIPRIAKTKALFIQSNNDAWAKLAATTCSGATVTPQCAQAAIVEAETECAASAKYFTKDTKLWRYLGFALIIASAGFTGVGASATIANAKVYSTLGGTTGLGAVTSTINANVTSDQTGLATVNTTLSTFLKYVQTAGTTDEMIYKSAPIYAGQCVAAATGSSGTSSK